MRYLSLCSGIEAATVAWRPLGWQAVAFAEIDPFPCALLAHYYPDVPNLGDVAEISDDDVAALGPIDVVIAGTPCQDLSVAGLRAGIDGERSRLFYDFVRICDAARRLCGARWFVWENVPNALGGNEGRDFACVVNALAGCNIAPPPDGFGSEGVALGEHGLLEWACLDAQWFGLAQRRERLFAVLDSGEWHHRSPVLLERDSLRGDSPPRRQSGPATARDLAPCLGGSGRGFERAGESRGQDCLVADGVTAYDVVAHALTGEGFDASEDGSGRGVPLVANPLTARMEKGINSNVCEGQTPIVEACFDETQITSAENRSSARADSAAMQSSARPPAIAFTERADGRNVETQAELRVRRLTPRECERLQGFEDDYTLIEYRGKPATDSPRYRALGNSMAMTVIRWIGDRIEAVMP